MLPKIIIFGRPNVGKSTLFNRLVKRKAAIVADIPGVTRDNKVLKASLGNFDFLLYDTAGFDKLNEKNVLNRDIIRNIYEIINIADVIIFLLDGKTGVLPFDYNCAEILRKVSGKVIPVMNKCESDIDQSKSFEGIKLGFGEPLILSAEHSIGFENLKVKLEDSISSLNKKLENYEDSTSIRLAIVGRPNSGKSTLINTLLGKNYVLTGDQPGVTRDAVMLNFVWKGENFTLIDTAGIRKKSKVIDKIEKLSVDAALDAVKYAQIVVLVLDCNEALSRQDLIIANHVVNEGRVLVIAANKWDLVKQPMEVKLELNTRLERTLSQLRGVKLVELSALKKTGISKLMSDIKEIYNKWNINISTAKLNKWLQFAQDQNPPPLKSGRVIKLKYCTQTSSRPPTFVFFTNLNSELSKSYQRYLLNNFRDEFGMDGVPIRILYKNSKNPFSN